MDPRKNHVLMRDLQVAQAERALRSEATPATPGPALHSGPTSSVQSGLSRLPARKTHGSVTHVSDSSIQTQTQTQHLEQNENLQQLLILPPVAIPPEQRLQTPYKMSCTLMEHQKVCLTWLTQQEEDASMKGGILAGKPQRISWPPNLLSRLHFFSRDSSQQSLLYWQHNALAGF